MADVARRFIPNCFGDPPTTPTRKNAHKPVDYGFTASRGTPKPANQTQGTVRRTRSAAPPRSARVPRPPRAPPQHLKPAVPRSKSSKKLAKTASARTANTKPNSDPATTAPTFVTTAPAAADTPTHADPDAISTCPTTSPTLPPKPHLHHPPAHPRSAPLPASAIPLHPQPSLDFTSRSRTGGGEESLQDCLNAGRLPPRKNVQDVLEERRLMFERLRRPPVQGPAVLALELGTGEEGVLEAGTMRSEGRGNGKASGVESVRPEKGAGGSSNSKRMDGGKGEGEVVGGAERVEEVREAMQALDVDVCGGGSGVSGPEYGSLAESGPSDLGMEGKGKGKARVGTNGKVKGFRW